MRALRDCDSSTLGDQHLTREFLKSQKVKVPPFAARVAREALLAERSPPSSHGGKLRFRVTALSGPKRLAQIDGILDVDPAGITLEDMRQVILCEQLLERLTGVRFHIEEVS